VLSFFLPSGADYDPSPGTNVFVSEVDLFDYKSGEPSPEFHTILRVIDVGLLINLP
jgi:hypothetical protein